MYLCDGEPGLAIGIILIAWILNAIRIRRPGLALTAWAIRYVYFVEFLALGINIGGKRVASRVLQHIEIKYVVHH